MKTQIRIVLCLIILLLVSCYFAKYLSISELVSIEIILLFVLDFHNNYEFCSADD